MTEPPSAALASTAPVVLVGGRSMVASPIVALREDFGPRVTVIGPCDPPVRALADAWLPDDHPGTGSMGGILTALERLAKPTLVLAGDMPAIDAATVRRLVHAALASPDAAVVMAMIGERKATRDHPYVVVYGGAMREILRSGLVRQRRGLDQAIADLPASAVLRVEYPGSVLTSINEESDLIRPRSSQNEGEVGAPIGVRPLVHAFGDSLANAGCPAYFFHTTLDFDQPSPMR
jgi:molybdopterin-guanine dinucleotide biosynthesis protein A